jgi:hypothetical protein
MPGGWRIHPDVERALREREARRRRLLAVLLDDGADEEDRASTAQCAGDRVYMPSKRAPS